MQEDNSHQVTGEAPGSVGAVTVPWSLADVVKLAISDGEYIGRHGGMMPVQEVLDLRAHVTKTRIQQANDARVTAEPSHSGGGRDLEPALPTALPTALAPQGEKTT